MKKLGKTMYFVFQKPDQKYVPQKQLVRGGQLPKYVLNLSHPVVTKQAPYFPECRQFILVSPSACPPTAFRK